MRANIHPTAQVHPDARIGEDSRVGAFSIIDGTVVIGKNCDIQEHVVIRSHTTLGDEVKVYPFAMLGGDPQHTKYKGEPTTLEIGNRVVIRESVTVHRGTSFGRGTTSIGDESFIMAYCHVAHDCMVGKNVTMANGTQLAGHVEIQDFVTLGGLSAVPQFLRVGRYAFVGGCSILRKDLPPFLVGKGADFEVQGVNLIGLGRRGFSPATLSRLKKLYKIFYLQNLTVAQAIEKAHVELGDGGEVGMFVDFVKESKAGIVR